MHTSIGMTSYAIFNMVLGDVGGVRQLVPLTEDLASALDSCDQIDIIALDFCKGFDKVPHQRLLLKLEQIGMRGNVKG